MPKISTTTTTSQYSTVFVYGSLLSGLGNHTLLERHRAINRGPATLKGKYEMLDLGSFPALVDSKTPNAIKGELYTVGPRGLKALDQLEGHPNFYKRTRVAVLNEVGHTVLCQTYILATTPQPRSGKVVSGDWAEYRATKNQPVFYFAYGSNMDKNQMTKRCPSSELVGVAQLELHRLAFTGYSNNRKGGVATVKPSLNNQVDGIIWQINRQDLAKLDRCEGTPHVYQRRTITVNQDGQAVQAQAYIKRANRESLPSVEYAKTIWNGYQQVGLDPKPITEAIRQADKQKSKKREIYKSGQSYYQPAF
jgi:gamma-glutamylcyclotransferase (GGCT)/AIG2-like uncharacterized protein YtfP